jgi:hypothetical protein
MQPSSVVQYDVMMNDESNEDQRKTNAMFSSPVDSLEE